MNSILRFLLEKNFRWTAGGVAIIVLALGYVFVIQGQVTSFRTNGLIEQTKVKNELASDQNYLQRLRASVSDFKTSLTDQDLVAIQNFIPTNPDFPGLLLTLKGLADSANLSLDSIAVGQAGTTSASGSAQSLVVAGLPLQAQDITLSVSGGTSYASFKQFLGLVEQSQRLMDVVSVNFTTGGTASTTATTATPTVGSPYALTIRTYYLSSTPSSPSS